MQRPCASKIHASSDPRGAPPPEEEPDEPLQVVFATDVEVSPDACPQPEESPSNKSSAS